MPTEQELILDHPPDRHGRILAGPGTGKSTTVLGLAERLVLAQPTLPVRVITFTRAATSELLKKIRDEGRVNVEPMTVHAFALGLLMRNASMTHLPLPLRIPDDWESNLIRADLARRLRARGFGNATKLRVERLESEMAAGWEKLEPGIVLLADIDPALRNAFLAAWQEHRRVFGYCLFAEMTTSAAELLEDHPDAQLPDLKVLIVDEFQDLNRADIAMVQAIAARNVSILGVGDDDQSIYSFRMAAPEGIRELHTMLPGVIDYTLSVSFRCGKRILEVARALIETAPGRPSRPALRPGPSNPEGFVHYLRFPGQVTERRGIAALVMYLSAAGLDYKDMVILLRGDHDRMWSKPLREVLTRAGIPSTDVEAATAPLMTSNARRLLSAARLHVTSADGLAWWTHLSQTHGISDDYLSAVADEALASGETFVTRVRRCPQNPPERATTASQHQATKAIRAVEELITRFEQEPLEAPTDGWAAWLLRLATSLSIPVAEDLAKLVDEVAKVVPPDEDLTFYLNQLEPLTKDLALQTAGVAIMTLTRSKGLTFRAVIICGVEDGVIPSGRPGANEDEERRLLYVGITRAREYCYMTMAGFRNDATARSGAGEVRSRSRCPFLATIRVRPEDGEEYIKQLAKGPRT